jgi:hypothetical protein
MLHRPRVYLAGKISKNGWRSLFVPNLRGVTVGQLVNCGRFIFGGPYFIACDHGCGHGLGAHGLDLTACTSPLGAPARWTVPSLCHHWISQADLVFAWINGPDCFNTLVEIGWAQQLELPVYVAFRNRSLARDMWFATHGPLTRSSIEAGPTAAFDEALNWASRLGRNASCLPESVLQTSASAAARVTNAQEVACH